MRIVYFVHDLNDSAVERRAQMLRAAGLDTTLTGFWRGKTPPSQIAGVKVVALDRTFDAHFVQRAVAALKNAAFARALIEKIGQADVLIARNLEMLAVAVATGGQMPRPPVIVYEVLDIHRFMLSASAKGKALRAFERLLMRRVDMLITSSPAFVREYFGPFQFKNRPLRNLLLENKELALNGGAGEKEIARLEAGPPWRIGWMGMLRCRRTVEILCGLARKRPDLVEIHINGRPTREVDRDFQKCLPMTPAMRFEGPYGREDIGRLYGKVHFNWAIDYFEANANSRLLLPNRIYEGGIHDVVPLALSGTETANWLKALGLGVVLTDPGVELEAFLDRLTPRTYEALKRASERAPRSAFVADKADCERFGDQLAAVVKQRAFAISTRRHNARERAIP